MPLILNFILCRGGPRNSSSGVLGRNSLKGGGVGSRSDINYLREILMEAIKNSRCSVIRVRRPLEPIPTSL